MEVICSMQGCNYLGLEENNKKSMNIRFVISTWKSVNKNE